MMKFNVFLSRLTLDLARDWDRSPEKWLYVADLLEDNGYRATEFTVGMVESVFDRLLSESEGASC